MFNFQNASDNEESDNEETDIETPLTRALMSTECSFDIVLRYIDDGIDVNSWSIHDGSPLLIALSYSRDEAIVKTLLEKGAKPDVELNGRTPMCYALCHGASKDVIRLLLEAGCSPNACRVHNSVLQCATASPNFNLKTGVLELLFGAGADLLPDYVDQSPICLALKAGAGIHDIQLLLEQGFKLDSCLEHDSVWFCATNKRCPMRLTTDVVELLLNAGVSMDVVNKEGWNPLQCALCDCSYEEKAIKLMLDQVSASNIRFRNDYSLLHLAVGNDHCNLSIVKLLVERGLKVNELNSCMETPLHRAVLSNCDDLFDIIDFLLKKGSPVNARNLGSYTPLETAVDLGKDCNIIQLLLAAGALVDDFLLKSAFKQFKVDQSDYYLEVLKLLLKYSFLQNINFKINIFDGGLKDYDVLASFAAECKLEVQKLDSAMIGHDYSLRDFLNDHSAYPMLAEVSSCEASHYVFNRLVRLMDNIVIPIFFDVISAKFGKIILEMRLQEYEVYAMKYSSFPDVAKKIILDCDSLSLISTHLSHSDLLKLIIAYACQE